MHIQSAALSQRTYVISFDVANRLQTLVLQGLSVPEKGHAIFRLFREELIRKVARALPSVAIRAIDMGELMWNVRDQILTLVGSGRNQPVLSTCFNLAAAIEGEILSINRLFGLHGEFLGYGPRPGSPSLQMQLDRFAQKVSRRQIIVVEDGAFTGKTLCFVLRRLKVSGVRVSKVLIGFCCSRAEKAVRQVFDGEIIIMERITGLVDWLPDHDLIPFTPHCGRVLGARSSKEFVPLEIADGIGFGCPYVSPFGTLGEWSSLSPTDALDLSRFCLDRSIEIFGSIALRSQRAISVRNLVSKTSGVLMPFTIGSTETLSLSTNVLEFLERKRALLG